MSTEREVKTREIRLSSGEILLDILTKLPKNVPYTELKLKTYVERYTDDEDVNVWLEYKSLETDDEYNSRINLEKIRQQNDEARERRQYEYLKTKYGS